MRPICEGLGAFGDLMKASCELQGGLPHAPTRFIAKFAPQGRTPIPTWLVKRSFLSEAHFYNDFTVDGGGLSRPECYLATADQSRLAFCMLIEDLMPAVSHTRILGCDSISKLTKVMLALASLHSRWWGLERAPELCWAPNPRSDYNGLVFYAYTYATRRGWRALARGPFRHTYALVLAWARRLRAHHRHLYRRLFRKPLTLCHGDVHLDNIFFGEHFRGGCALVDFGNMSCAPALSDVAFFLATNVEPDARRKHEADLLRVYYDALVAGGVRAADYPWERCWEDYRLQLWRPFVALLILAPSFEKEARDGAGMFAPHPTPADERTRAMYERFNERLVTALIDHNWVDLLPTDGCCACQCNPCRPCCLCCP